MAKIRKKKNYIFPDLKCLGHLEQCRAKHLRFILDKKKKDKNVLGKIEKVVQ